MTEIKKIKKSQELILKESRIVNNKIKEFKSKLEDYLILIKLNKHKLIIEHSINYKNEELIIEFNIKYNNYILYNVTIKDNENVIIKDNVTKFINYEDYNTIIKEVGKVDSIDLFMNRLNKKLNSIIHQLEKDYTLSSIKGKLFSNHNEKIYNNERLFKLLSSIFNSNYSESYSNKVISLNLLVILEDNLIRNKLLTVPFVLGREIGEYTKNFFELEGEIICC